MKILFMDIISTYNTGRYNSARYNSIYLDTIIQINISEITDILKRTFPIVFNTSKDIPKMGISQDRTKIDSSFDNININNYSDITKIGMSSNNPTIQISL